MIFADKLIQLRKKSGWSQEELAAQMNVSRQSVSKWEGAQSVPDLEKILRLAQLFGVTTDYLLKDELDTSEAAPASAEPAESSPLRRLSMEEASAYLTAKQKTAAPIAWGVFLCITSVVWLLLLGGLQSLHHLNVAKNVAGGAGLILLFVQVTVAVVLFLYSGTKTSAFVWLEKTPFETEYGITGMVEQRRAAFRDSYMKNNIIGVVLCILCVVPLLLAFMLAPSDQNILLGILLMFMLAGIAVLRFVQVGIVWGSFAVLLQEGDYNKASKRISGIYWPCITALYLVVSFWTRQWNSTWIIWAAAGILFPAVAALNWSHWKKQ